MYEIILPHSGNCDNGMKIPLMKTRGNFTSEESIIPVEGISVGG